MINFDAYNKIIYAKLYKASDDNKLCMKRAAEIWRKTIEFIRKLKDR